MIFLKSCQVGGDFSVTVLQHMNSLGRVSICGIISKYNTNQVNSGPKEQPTGKKIKNNQKTTIQIKSIKMHHLICKTIYA